MVVEVVVVIEGLLAIGGVQVKFALGLGIGISQLTIPSTTTGAGTPLHSSISKLQQYQYNLDWAM